MATKKKISEESWINALLEDGKPIENVSSLFGYVGPSEVDDCLRLYFDLTLQNHIDIKHEDVLHNISLSKSQSPLGGDYIWIKRATEYLYNVSYDNLKNAQAANYYFQGNIYNQYAEQNNKDENGQSKVKPATTK